MLDNESSFNTCCWKNNEEYGMCWVPRWCCIFNTMLGITLVSVFIVYRDYPPLIILILLCMMFYGVSLACNIMCYDDYRRARAFKRVFIDSKRIQNEEYKSVPV